MSRNSNGLRKVNTSEDMNFFKFLFANVMMENNEFSMQEKEGNISKKIYCPGLIYL